jgi:hypothetical protein
MTDDEVHPVADGVLIPDSDFAQAWREVVTATAEHYYPEATDEMGRVLDVLHDLVHGGDRRQPRDRRQRPGHPGERRRACRMRGSHGAVSRNAVGGQ